MYHIRPLTRASLSLILQVYDVVTYDVVSKNTQLFLFLSHYKEMYNAINNIEIYYQDNDTALQDNLMIDK
jgi:hypothetical protein